MKEDKPEQVAPSEGAAKKDIAPLSQPAESTGEDTNAEGEKEKVSPKSDTK